MVVVEDELELDLLLLVGLLLIPPGPMIFLLKWNFFVGFLYLLVGFL